MKRLLIQLPEELHRDLRELAHRRKTSMSELVRQAIEAAYEDDLDGALAGREFQSYMENPSDVLSLDEYLAARAGRVVSR